MAFDIPDLFGYHATSCDTTRVVGGKNEMEKPGVLPLWDLWAVRYAILPAGAQLSTRFPGSAALLDSVTIFEGRASTYRALGASALRRVVAAAIQGGLEAIIPTLLHPAWTSPGSSCSRTISPITPEPLKQMELPRRARRAPRLPCGSPDG